MWLYFVCLWVRFYFYFSLTKFFYNCFKFSSGATLECWPSNSSRPAAVESTFVLTLATREKVYGTAITFYEDFDEESLTDEQKDMLQLKKWTRKSDRKILANKCICLLSRWPFFEAFKNFLFFLHKRQLMGKRVF